MGGSIHDGLRGVELRSPRRSRLPRASSACYIYPCAHAVSPSLSWRAVSIIISKGACAAKAVVAFPPPPLRRGPRIGSAPQLPRGPDHHVVGSYWDGTLAWTGAGGASDQIRSDQRSDPKVSKRSGSVSDLSMTGNEHPM